MKPNLTLLTALLLVPLTCFGDDSTMHLQVSPNGRFLQYADGTPFFYLADTAWMLTNKLTEEEARRLFADRSAKGFTVIQALIFRDLFVPNTPNVHGVRPFANEADMYAAKLNPKWLDGVVRITKMAAEHGLVMAWLGPARVSPAFSAPGMPSVGARLLRVSFPPSLVSLNTSKEKHNTVYFLVYFPLSRPAVRAYRCFSDHRSFGAADRCEASKTGKGLRLERNQRYAEQAVFA
jgi:hypothetical protein